MNRYLIIISLILLSSCSYLPEEPVEGMHLKEENADYALYFAGEQMPEKAFLFIPGGLVDPYAYSCWIDELASLAANIAIVLVKYPSNLAISNIGKAHAIQEEFEEIDSWIIGGHSLGGVVATTLVHDNPDAYDGLVLMASWSREATDLSDWSGIALSLYASEDSLATAEEVFANEIFLPEAAGFSETVAMEPGRTYYYEIEGGNHAGFGCYGEQEGDGVATIDKQSQQQEMMEVLQLFMEALWN